MLIKILPNCSELGQVAADEAAVVLRDAIARQGKARIIAATGASQISFLKELTASPKINWQQIEMFHLDEYVGLPITHGASFRKYLLERLIKPACVGRYHLLDGEGDVAVVCRKIGAELNAAPIDVAFVGIGENGHLAFNDPPADFETEQPYLVVDLDEACRRQQVGEGWFNGLDDVPTQAISMSIRQIMTSPVIICGVPDARKAKAVQGAVEGPTTPQVPASI